MVVTLARSGSPGVLVATLAPVSVNHQSCADQHESFRLRDGHGPVERHGYVVRMVVVKRLSAGVIMTSQSSSSASCSYSWSSWRIIKSISNMRVASSDHSSWASSSNKR